MAEQYETGDTAEPTLPWAEVPDLTIIYDMDGGRELLRIRGLVPLPIGAGATWAVSAAARS